MGRGGGQRKPRSEKNRREKRGERWRLEAGHREHLGVGADVKEQVKRSRTPVNWCKHHPVLGEVGLLSLPTKAFTLVSRPIHKHFRGDDITEREEHLHQLSVPKLLGQMVDEQVTALGPCGEGGGAGEEGWRGGGRERQRRGERVRQRQQGGVGARLGGGVSFKIQKWPRKRGGC